MECAVEMDGGKTENGRKQLTPERKLIARKRWEFLINVMISKKARVDPTISVRRFASFGLLHTEKLEYDRESVSNTITGQKMVKKHYWYKYTSSQYPQYQVYIRHLDGSLDIADVLGFNNTGNVCVWPSEEVLTNYCLQHAHMFSGKSVCELGGGMTSLAGIAVAQCTEAKEVLLTDGNEASVHNIDKVIERNKTSFCGTQVTAQMLRWDECPTELAATYDMVICADCLFFDDYREDLINVIHWLLKPGGEVIMLAPHRGKTFTQFKQLIDDRFNSVTHDEKYDDHIWQLHQKNLTKGRESYDADIHYPMLLTFRKNCDQDS